MLKEQSLNKQEIAYQLRMLYFERNKKLALERNFLRQWILMIACMK